MISRALIVVKWKTINKINDKDDIITPNKEYFIFTKQAPTVKDKFPFFKSFKHNCCLNNKDPYYISKAKPTTQEMQTIRFRFKSFNTWNKGLFL